MDKAIKLFERAESRRAGSRYDQAVKLYLEAKRLAPRNAVELKADIALALGDTYRMIGEFTRAARCYKEARGLSARLSDETMGLDAGVGLGLSLRAMGGYREALALFNRCIRRYKAMGDLSGLAFTLWARAGALRFRGDVKRGIEGFKEARELFAAIKDPAGVAYCLTGLGGSTRVLGLHADSLKYYKDSNARFKRLNDTFGLAYSYCGIANAMRMSGDFSGSLKYFSLAKVNYKKIGDRVSYAYTLWGEGSAMQMLGRDALARMRFSSALKLFKETRDRRGEVYCMLTTGQLDVKRDVKKGVGVLKRAEKSAAGLGLKVEAAHARRLIKAAEKAPEELPVNLP